MPGISEKTIEAASTLFEQGLKAPEIALKLSISRSHAYRALHAAGIYPDGTGAYPFKQSYKKISVDPLWAAEFRGFFYADGCIYIGRRNYKKGHLYLPRMSVSARADNLAVLKEMAHRLSGKVQYKEGKPAGDYQCNPSAQWYLSGWAAVRSAIEAVDLMEAIIPAKKAVEVALVYEAILARFSMPHRLGRRNVEILKGYYLRSKELKRFKVQAG